MGTAPQPRQQVRDAEVDVGQFPAARPYPSLSEVWDASRTVQGLDNSDAHARRLDEAYDPVIAAINRVRAREGKPLLASPSNGWVMADKMPDREVSYVGGGGLAPGLQPDKRGEDAAIAQVMSEIARIKRAYPGALKGVPDKADAIIAPLVARDAAARDKGRDTLERSSGLAAGVTQFGGMLYESFKDPLVIASLPFGGGGKTTLGVAARFALVGGVTEMARLPGISGAREDLGEELTFGEGVQRIGETALIGGAFGGVVHNLGNAFRYGYRGGRKLMGNFNDALPERLRLPNVDTPIAELPDEALSELAKAQIGRERMTPDERAAVDIIDRQTEVEAVSPYARDGAGLDANATALERAMAEVAATPEAKAVAATVPRETSGSVPRPVAAAQAPGLTQDSIIKFVIRDLEGGGKVVDNGDGAGTTKYGITAKNNPGVDVANLTEEQAAAIARRRYWLPEFSTADPRVAAVAFDANYLRSPKLARRILREAANDPARAVEIYRADLMALIERDPSKAKFRKSWNNRLDRLRDHLDANPVARLDPARFGGDTELYRAQQAALDAESMQMVGDTPQRADPIGDYVDSLFAADERARADLGGDDFARANAEAIDGEIARRRLLGTDEPIAARAPEVGRETGGDVSRGTAVPPSLPSTELGAQGALARPDLLLAVKAYAGNRANSLRLDRIAAKLGISEGEAASALEVLSGAQNSSIKMTRGRMVPKRGADGKFIWTDRGSKRVRVTEWRPPRFIRKARYSTPDDVVRYLARHGGLRDDEGHDLAGMGYGALSGSREGFLLRKDGMSLDRARELLEEADFFIDSGFRGTGVAISTENDVLELLARAARGEKVYPLTASIDDIGPRIDLDAEREKIWQELMNADPLLERLEPGLVDDMAALIVDRGFTPEQARIEIAERELADMLDEMYAENGDATYDWRGEADQAPGGDQGHLVEWRDEGEPGYDAYVRAALEGIERDRALQGGDSSEGLGPPSLDPALHGIDDPVGAEAAAIADNGFHDLRAAVEAADPNIAARQRQEAQLGAEAPMRARADQESTIGSPLFDAVDQGALNIDIDGRSMSAADAIKEIDADQAAIDAIKGCL